MKRFAELIESKESPEYNLWMRVLDLAFSDLYSEKHRAEAIRFFTDKKMSRLEEICNLVGLDVDWVRDLAQGVINVS